MRVQLVGDEQPDGLRIGIDGLRDVGREVGFRARRAECGRHNLATHDIEVGDQAHCAVADIFKLAPFDLAWPHRFGWSNPFERLNTGHLIATQDMAAQAVEQWCIGVDGTDGFNLLAKGDRICRFSFGVQPIATTMRLQIGLALTSARLNGLR